MLLVKRCYLLTLINIYWNQANYEAGYVVLRVDEIVDQLFQIGYLDTILDDPTDGQVLLDGAVDVFPYFVNPTLNNGKIFWPRRVCEPSMMRYG